MITGSQCWSCDDCIEVSSRLTGQGGNQVGRVGSKSSRPIQPAKKAQSAAPSSVGVRGRTGSTRRFPKLMPPKGCGGRGPGGAMTKRILAYGLTRLPILRRGEIGNQCRIAQNRRKSRRKGQLCRFWLTNGYRCYRFHITSYRPEENRDLKTHSAHSAGNVGSVRSVTIRPGSHRNLLDARYLDRRSWETNQ